MHRISIVALGLCLGFAAPGVLAAAPTIGTLHEPAYCEDFVLRGEARPYVPQAGDIVLFTDDHSLIWKLGFNAALSGHPHHACVVIQMADGTLALLDSSPDDTRWIQICELEQRLMWNHCQRGRVWVRRRSVPLTPEQSWCLTAFAMSQQGKRYSVVRLAGQLTPLRNKVPLVTAVRGKPRGSHNSYFCSEVALEALVYAGLLDPHTTRPRAAYPREMFFDRSPNPYVNRTFDMSCQWEPPARWVGPCDNCCPPQHKAFRPHWESAPVHPLVRDVPYRAILPRLRISPEDHQ